MSVTLIGKKRQRDYDEEDDAGPERPGAGHTRKRRAPLNTSFDNKPGHAFQTARSTFLSSNFSSDPPTLTPADSDEDPPSPSHTIFSASPFTTPQTRSMEQLHSPNDDPDLEMRDSTPSNLPAAATTLLSPFDESSVTDRIPTPILNSFPSMHQQSRRRNALAICSKPLGNPGAGPRVEPSDFKSSQLFQRRRLPSPISETEDTLSPMSTNVAGEMLLRLDFGGKDEQDAQHYDAEAMDVESRDPSATEVHDENERGRARHRPGSEKQDRPRIAMGYRADCEKCKARVPGHYSHIVRD